MDQADFYRAKLHFETDAWDLSEALGRGDNVVVIDARSAEAYQRAHIPSAINLPHRLITHDATAHLDKASLYVTYCDGIGCNASTKAALKMSELGFTVKELLGGLDWWHRDGYASHGSAGRDGKRVECGC